MQKTKAQPTTSGNGHTVATQLSPTILKHAHLVKGTALKPLEVDVIMLYQPAERVFRSAKELEELIQRNSKMLFGEQAFLLTTQKKNARPVKNDDTPVYFLLDVNPTRPQVYVLDIMLVKQPFFAYTFPRITKFLTYFNNAENVETLCSLIGKNKEIMKALQGMMRDTDIPDFLKGVFKYRSSILLVMDKEMPEIAGVKAAYAEQWHRVKPVVVKKYANNGSTICALNPPFSDIHLNGKVVKERKAHRESVPMTEQDHVAKTSPALQEVYDKIKAELLKTDTQLQFNPQRYYISLKKGRNLAFFHFYRKSISLVVMCSETDTSKIVKHYDIKILTEKVQKFWNGTCCTIVIDNPQHLDEVIGLLKKLILA